MVAWRLLAVLLVFGAALVVLTLPVAAEDPANDGGEPALAAHEIQWTRYPAGGTERIREGFGNAIWGGGSFLKLIGKLVIEGCDVNAIAVYDAEGEEMLFFHHFQAPDFVNADFGRGQYMADVPAGSVLAFTCVDACDILIGPGAAEAKGKIETCMSTEEFMEEHGDNDLLFITSDCRKMDFPAEVNRQFAPFAPMYQDVCMVDFSASRSESKIGGFATMGHIKNFNFHVYYKRSIPFIANNIDHLAQEKNNDYFYYRRGVLHELCHQQQFWYINRFYNTYDFASNEMIAFWEETEAGMEFVDMIGYKKVGEDYWEWDLDEDNEYYGGSYTNSNPQELAAYLCSDYFMEKMGLIRLFTQPT